MLAERSSLPPLSLAPRCCDHKEDRDHISNFLDGCGEQRYVYQHPIFIPIATTSTCLTIPSDASLGEAILFNLALSTHLSILAGNHKNDSEKQRFELDRAIELYNIAYKLQLYHHGDDDSESPPSVLFLVAIANNLSEAYRFQHNASKADGWGRYLLSMLMWILVCRRDNERYDTVEHISNDYNGVSRRSHNSNNHNHGGNHTTTSNNTEGDVLDCFLGNTMHLIEAKDGRDAAITAPAA